MCTVSMRGEDEDSEVVKHEVPSPCSSLYFTPAEREKKKKKKTSR